MSGVKIKAMSDKTGIAVFGRTIPNMPESYHDLVFDIRRDDHARLNGWSTYHKAHLSKERLMVWKACEAYRRERFNL